LTGIGCIGCGAWGANLLRVWDETVGARVAGICRGNPGRLGELDGQCPEARRHATVEELLGDASVDAVSIATPPGTHEEIARKALLAGKHVFVEKPMCLDVAGARALAELADAQGKVLMVGHLMEHHGAVRAIKRALDEGAIGKVRHLHFQRLKLGRVRSQEDVLWSFAPHDFSIASYLLGTAPQEVRAVGHAYVQPQIADIVFVDARYADGVSVHVHVSWLHPQTVRQLVVVGAEGMIVWDDMARQDALTLARKSVGPDLRNVEGETVPLDFEAAQPLQAECACFVECIVSGCRPPNDGWDGVRVVQMLEAASEALLTGAAARA
jgi:UDP-2-acetamido-3-amino-2,3-dideoxy-glucuronate N-acetyltransferase